jgi:Arc/MetJ family transcription regulator
MATNLQIDDALIHKAVTLGGHRTKRAAVTKALEEYIDHLEQEKILKLFGTVDYDPGYDYKDHRRRS